MSPHRPQRHRSATRIWHRAATPTGNVAAGALQSRSGWSGRLSVGVVMFALVVVGAPSPASAAPPSGIRVLQSPTATFRTLNCTVNKYGFRAVGYSRSGWKLTIAVHPFRGYRRYRVPYGPDGDVAFGVRPPPGVPLLWSNLNEPPPELVDNRLAQAGGELSFPGGRSRLALGMAFVYERDYRDQPYITVAGTAACRYRGRRR